METFVKNLVTEIKNINKTNFTKNEILDLINIISDNTHKPKLVSNDVEIDPEFQVVTVDGVLYDKIPKKVFELLYYFIENKNSLLTRDKILRDVWGYEIAVSHRTVDVHVRKIRMMLKENYIITNKALGYRWIQK